MTISEPQRFVNLPVSPMTSKGEEAPYASAPKQVDLGVEEAKDGEEEVPVPEPGESPVPEPDDVRKPRVGRRPVLPAKADIENHYPLHLQYRDWCPQCVAGKAVLEQHQVEPSDRERLGVTVSADYAFIASEEKEEGMQPFLVMFDSGKKAFWAIGVAAKEVSEPLVEWVKGVLDQSVYEGEKSTFKTDQEPSIVALKKAVSVARMGETVPI